MVARQNGGAGEQINLVPMARGLNQGAYKALEKEIHRLCEEGHEVHEEIQIEYGDNKRPVFFNIEYWIDGIKQASKFFLNE